MARVCRPRQPATISEAERLPHLEHRKNLSRWKRTLTEGQRVRRTRPWLLPASRFRPKNSSNTPQPHKLVDWGTFPHDDKDKGDSLVADWAVEKLKSDQLPEEPFFLSVGFFLPHVPCYATQKWFDLPPGSEYQTTTDPRRRPGRHATAIPWYIHWKLPEPRLKFLEESNETLNITRSYLACISFVDHQVGRVLDALEESGVADNTIVVLWSDHGFHLGEKQITGKNTLWDRSTRVPLIFAGPGISENAKTGQPAELLDIYPTLLELTGLPANENNEGISLLPQLKDATTKRERPAITSHGPGNHGVRSENWRYIRYADGSEELYDMAKRSQRGGRISLALPNPST